MAVPFQYSLWAFHDAQAYDWAPQELRVAPSDLLGHLMVEQGSAAPFGPDSVGKDGEMGLCQLSYPELKEYNEFSGDSYSMEDLLDPRINTRVAAHTFYEDKRRHAKTSYCKDPVPDGVELASDGSITSSYREPRHQEQWIADLRACNWAGEVEDSVAGVVVMPIARRYPTRSRIR